MQGSTRLLQSWPEAIFGHIERRIIEEFGYQEVGHFRQVVIYN